MRLTEFLDLLHQVLEDEGDLVVGVWDPGWDDDYTDPPRVKVVGGALQIFGDADA